MAIRTTRREMLARTASVGFGLAALGDAEQASASTHVPIIDTHQHLWDMRKFSPP
jgi:hypothetical protein